MFLKRAGEMANRPDPVQNALPLIWVYTVDQSSSQPHFHPNTARLFSFPRICPSSQ